MFNSEFYPTPTNVAQRMLFNHDITNKIILEPQSGKGDLIDEIKLLNPKEILSCEQNKELAEIVKTKCDRFLGYDFFELKSEQISHIDFIIMNPPFSNAIKHIEHAFKIAPDGCVIISLINYSNYKDSYSRTRESLKQLVSDYGSIENLGDVFSNAERKTDISVGLITLFKPKQESDFEFDGYFDLSEEYENIENGILKHNEIQELVNRYVYAIKQFNSVYELNKSMNEVIAPITNKQFQFGAFQVSDRNGDRIPIDRNTFKKELQKTAWKEVFKKFKMEKYVTVSVLNDINKFVEMQQNIPFTVKNIYKMVEMIVGTRKQTMERVVVESFECICGFSAKNNTAGETWKTNSDYKINQKFIHPWIVENSWGKMSIKYQSRDMFNDILKALCYISGKKYDDMLTLDMLFYTGSLKYLPDDVKNNKYWNPKIEKNSNGDEEIFGFTFGEWVNWNDMFEVKGFKKGTMHFKFIDLDLWQKFNTEYARIKDWRLPKETDSKTKGTERTKTKNLVTL